MKIASTLILCSAAVLSACAQMPAQQAPAPAVAAAAPVAPAPAAVVYIAPAAPVQFSVTPTAEQLAIAARAGVEPAMLNIILNKQIYQMSPVEAGRYIAYIHEAEPDFRKRIAAIGRKNIGQAYKLNLLGEFPYELHDDLPMFSLTHGDCVVFSEHTYAMALSRSWEEFFWVLQRIRYNKGVIGVATRNHYTELDWNINNGWLVTDVSAQLAGARTAQYPLTVDRANFLRTRHKTPSNLPVENSTQDYVPHALTDEVIKQLNDGDFVNVISTDGNTYWASHVGMVVVDANGKRNFLNSIEPYAREEGFEVFIGRQLERENRLIASGKKNVKRLAGFKFLRLNDKPEVPPMAPQPRPGRA
ncbi:MAG TPA: N-acetylmuramoyl-L-alanine amidase-like domain-containing protein [Burkholderiaceae bacterium]